MAKVKETKLSELIPDDKNMNKHNQYGMSLLEKSVSKLGLGRSILVDKNNRIIAGNGVTETAANLGLDDVIIVPTNGRQLVVVQRTDLDLDSKEARELALADNAVAHVNLEWDEEQLQAVTEEWGIEAKEWGVKIDSEIDVEANSDNKYTQKVTAPIYEPKNEKPEIYEVYNQIRYNELIDEINNSKLKKEEKDFLKLAATRHIVFNYEKIADLYAHSSKNMQELMEMSALIIIDFDKAIELGYVALSEDVLSQYNKEDEE